MNRRALIGVAFALGAGFVAWALWNASVFRSARTEPQTAVSHPPSQPLYEDATERAGIDFTIEPGPLDFYQVPQVIGSGCAFFDFDQDGDLDILLINQAGGAGYGGEGESSAPSTATPTNRLYRQNDDGRFVDVTSGSGLDVVGVGMGVAVGDVNNDGFPDVCITYFRGARLFLNLRDGTFADISQAAGIDDPLWGTACAFVDFDRDGWLDLFVANYDDYHTGRRCTEPDGKREFCQPNGFVGTPHKLFRNESGRFGAGGAAEPTGASRVQFVDVSLSSGIARKVGLGLGVVPIDVNDDRWPDLFVANDLGPNYLWINQHDGTFSEESLIRGAAYDLKGRPQANMGIAIGDVDGDGRFDLLVTHFDGEMNALYLQKSTGMFEESAGITGLGAPSLPYTSWGTSFFDVDHDGDLDLPVVNGRVRRIDAGRTAARMHYGPSTAPSEWQAYAEPNQFFLNDGTGQFSEVPAETEPFCNCQEIARGLAVGDIDNDGDLDLLVTNVAGRARLFVNVAPKRGHWLQVRVVEPALGGRDAYGAVVKVAAGSQSWLRSANPASSYLSSNDPRVHFGLGPVDHIDSIIVTWADGVDEVFAGGAVDRPLVLRRGEGSAP